MPPKKIEKLLKNGVSILAPQSIEVDGNIDIDRISSIKTTIHAGCKLFGKNTLICDGAEIGLEGPVTIKNCYVGPGVKLKGGYFENAVFLEGAEAGSGSHVRAGTILEEQASIAHTVGLKQTILFPYVTLGSLINFCDCLMAGGTSRKNHSEVGSSYIHFNYTPNQDKATPSLIGDVPQGVMMNQSPIFLGGQGGLVGPCRLAYGTIVAAGSICRKDQMDEDHLVIEAAPKNARIPFKPGRFQNIKRVLRHNFYYIGNLIALCQWYRLIRSLFIGPQFPVELSQGLIATLKTGIEERIKQLGRLKEKIQATIPDDGSDSLDNLFCRNWEDIQGVLVELQDYEGKSQNVERFSEIIHDQIQSTGKDYLAGICQLKPDQASLGSLWLQEIVDHVNATLFAQLKGTER